MNKIETAKKNVKDFASKVGNEAKALGSKAIDFGVENKELCIAMIPVVVGALQMGRSHVVSHRAKTERRRIEHTYYDPSSGMHWELKRKATNADRAEILRRKAQGEDIYNILRQMNLIR